MLAKFSNFQSNYFFSVSPDLHFEYVQNYRKIKTNCVNREGCSFKNNQCSSRYVIFDEVHCIGGEHGGEVWEHLLTLVRCPFLALSATIGNPEFFHGWLRAVNKFKEQQVNFKA